VWLLQLSGASRSVRAVQVPSTHLTWYARTVQTHGNRLLCSKTERHCDNLYLL
jgi:hypothetical protein